MNKPQLPNITLKELLEKNVNLLTILGIFNALVLYAQSEKNELLAFCFLGISIIVASIVINDFFKYKITPVLLNWFFTTILLLAQIELVYSLIRHYPKYIMGILSLIGILYLMYSIPYLFVILTIKKARGDKRSTVIFVIVSTIITIIILYLIKAPMRILILTPKL